jgi:ABC-type transport system involved in multi-copper enzyme maturation permease subunit
VAWLALRARLVRVRPLAVVGWVAAVGALAATYLVAARSNALDEFGTHMAYILSLGIIGTIWAAALAASGIAPEREAGTWPLLLATPLTGPQIVLGKAIGVFRRCLPPWILLGFHLVLSAATGLVHPSLLVHVGMMVLGVVAFLTGTGLFFSTCFRQTWAAVAMNLGLGIAFWWILPMMVSLALAIAGLLIGPVMAVAAVYVSTHPIVQLAVLTEATAGAGHAKSAWTALEYAWPLGRTGVAGSTLVAGATMAGHVAAGFLFAWWASARVRKSVF